MILPIVLIGLALFVMAFIGINKFLPTVFGLASVVGLIFGIYLVFLGFTASNENRFIWGFFLLLVSGGVLVYLKSAFSD
jgi:high-affinity Fe2+/Pb2+ permease